MRVDGSGVTHISVARTPSFGAEQKSPSGGGGGGVNLWEPLGAKPVGTESVRVTNKLAPLKITSDYQESSLENSASTEHVSPDRQQQLSQQQKQEQQRQKQQQQQPQEHMRLWKRFGDPTPISPVTPNQPLYFSSAMSPTSVKSPMTPISGLNLD